jgi:poly-beta-hydroxyalkanoate depolymerase
MSGYSRENYVNFLQLAEMIEFFLIRHYNSHQDVERREEEKGRKERSRRREE